MTWISVKDDLPKLDGDDPSVNVLAAWGPHPGNVAEMSYCADRNARTPKGREARFRWQGRNSPWIVTHWQPLPAPPEEEPKHGE